MHPSCRHAAIASDWLLYGYLGEFARVSASQESCGTMRKKLGGYGDFGGFGGGPKSGGKPMVCIDCGYIYRGGDFDSLPKDWECPPCGSLKNRFKVYQEGNAYDQLAAQKAANKAAMAAKKKGGPSKRQLLKQKMMEEQAAMDKKKGGGFFGR